MNKLNADIKTLENELAKGINTTYLKHVLLQFIFTNDIQVQERLLNVMSTILCFTQDEVIKIKEHRSSKGVLTKFLKWA